MDFLGLGVSAGMNLYGASLGIWDGVWGSPSPAVGAECASGVRALSSPSAMGAGCTFSPFRERSLNPVIQEASRSDTGVYGLLSQREV